MQETEQLLGLIQTLEQTEKMQKSEEEKEKEKERRNEVIVPTVASVKMLKRSHLVVQEGYGNYICHIWLVSSN